MNNGAEIMVPELAPTPADGKFQHATVQPRTADGTLSQPP